MQNLQIAECFDELADRLALTDEKPFRVMAYRRAATTFRELSESAEVLSHEGRLREVEGVGPAIEEKVESLIKTGSFRALDRARLEVADTLVALTKLPGVGPKTALKIYATLNEPSFTQILSLAEADALTVGGGLTKKIIATLKEAAAKEQTGDGVDANDSQFSGVPRDAQGQPLSGLWLRRDEAQQLELTLAQLLANNVKRVEFSGDYARGCELLQTAQILIELAPPSAETESPAKHDSTLEPAFAQQLSQQVQNISAMLKSRGWQLNNTQLNVSELGEALLELTTPAEVPLALILTNSANKMDALRDRYAGPLQWFTHAKNHAVNSEQVPLELRDAVISGLAVSAIKPDLITANDINGELHAHSDWSDGHATILQMAHAARAQGDTYICITDHSAPYALVNGLNPERLAQQAALIREVNEQLEHEHQVDNAPAFLVLHGSEVEILADGSLGLANEELEKLDWVVASLHSQQKQDQSVIDARIKRVLDNPLVDALGHPTSRRLKIRNRTKLDLKMVIEHAAKSGIALEINANPDRLDLDSKQAAAAAQAGCLITINTDAHRTQTLAHRTHGIAIARRANISKAQVVNTYSAEKLQTIRRRNRG